MKLRWYTIALLIALPIGSVAAVVYFSSPAIVTSAKPKASGFGSHAPAQVVVPQTLSDAKKLTRERLKHLKGLTQAQWDEERKTITARYPPRLLAAAIERTERRLSDLDEMNDSDWELEKERLTALNKELLER